MMTFHLSSKIKIMALVLTFPTDVQDEKDFGGSCWSGKASPQGGFFPPSPSHNMG